MAFCEPPPLKVRFFSEPTKYWSFSFLTPCYNLKVTKFLGNIFQFKVLVMTGKNDFAYKLCLPLNISDFNLFLCENCNFPPLSQQLPSKSWGLIKPPSLKICLEAQPPLPAERGDGGHTMINGIDQHIIWSFAQNYKQRFLYWVQKTFKNPAFKLTGITKSLTKHTSVQQNSHCSEH